MYGLIVEWKNEAPSIMEGKPLNYYEAQRKMQELADNNRVIRVAVFKILYETGNEALIPGDKQEGF